MHHVPAWVSTHEHIFELGARLPLINSMTAMPDENRYRALYMFPFHPFFVVDIYELGSAAEIRVIMMRDHEGTSDEKKASWRWEREVTDAFEKDIPPSDSLPGVYRFTTTQANLSASQIRWLGDQFSNLLFSTFESDDPSTSGERDGEFLRGRVATFNAIYCFDIWSVWHRNNGIELYLLSLFQLACSVVEDAEIRDELLQIQRYFYGFDGRLYKDFVFPLIADS
jgi:hypothetical protein